MEACPPARKRSPWERCAPPACAASLIYCSDYKCSNSIAIMADRWADDVRLSDIEPRFVCRVCGKRGADVRPDFHWKGPPVAMMGYR
jgi:hypothetical protein